MRIELHELVLRTRRTTESISFSPTVTFLHGPVGTGKSTVARLIDYCLGGDLERTPALQREMVAAELFVQIGDYRCAIERGSEDAGSVRVTWSSDADEGSVNAPLAARQERLIDADVHNFSDLLFHLAGVMPIKVRQRMRDPESPLIRLSVRDVWWYCYLDQAHLDSSFFHLDDPFKGRKSQDVMRFFTGLHSERMSQLETRLMRLIDDQRAKREAVSQIRAFMKRFDLGSEQDAEVQLESTEEELREARRRLRELEEERRAETHPSDDLRAELRALGSDIADIRQALADNAEVIEEQRALRAELITSKTKAERAHEAGTVLDRVSYERCPQCGTDVSDRLEKDGECLLCGTEDHHVVRAPALEREAMRRDLNERIDQIGDSLARRKRELKRLTRELARQQREKAERDAQLQAELARYDSAFVESVRSVEAEIATLVERMRSMQRLQEMPRAIDDLEERAGELQGRIDRLKTMANEERERLRDADANIAAIAEEFQRVMLSVGFPGVSADDRVVIDPRNWKPTVVHGDQQWTFWDTGSGGKKTLFNVCYALAIHAVADFKNMPVPPVLIIDSPTKNISEDENPELVRSLYREIYRLASAGRMQFLLIDSDLVPSETDLESFSERRLAGEEDAPSLIPYYEGP